jgi:hypothetical protein
MTGLAAWLGTRTADAPPPLRECVREYAGRAHGTDPAQALASAGRQALARATESPGDRSSALDLLAADGLITLALLWTAEHEPARLASVALDLAAMPPS